MRTIQTFGCRVSTGSRSRTTPIATNHICEADPHVSASLAHNRWVRAQILSGVTIWICELGLNGEVQVAVFTFPGYPTRSVWVCVCQILTARNWRLRERECCKKTLAALFFLTTEWTGAVTAAWYLVATADVQSDAGMVYCHISASDTRFQDTWSHTV